MGHFLWTVMPHLNDVYRSVRRQRSAEGISGLPRVSQAADSAAQFMIRHAAWTPLTTGISGSVPCESLRLGTRASALRRKCGTGLPNVLSSHRCAPRSVWGDEVS